MGPERQMQEMRKMLCGHKNGDKSEASFKCFHPRTGDTMDVLDNGFLS